jgi:hypothetical protein
VSQGTLSLPPSGWRSHPFKDVSVCRAVEPRGSDADPLARQGPGLETRAVARNFLEDLC